MAVVFVIGVILLSLSGLLCETARRDFARASKERLKIEQEFDRLVRQASTYNKMKRPR